MRVDELAYIVLETVDVEAWVRYAQGVLGFEVVRDGASVRLRMDSRPFRYLLRKGKTDGLPILGWQVADAENLEWVVARVRQLDLDVVPLDRVELRDRHAAAGVRLTCRNGITFELAYGLTAAEPFSSRGDVTGFVTSSGGLGHVVWTVPDVEEMDRLMIDAFGMSLRENILTPLGTGHFYGCNPRHHSLAVLSGPTLRLEHLMVEMKELDDVGRAMDRAEDAGYMIPQPLGRHRTDHMVSFYVQTPNGFGMEIGFDGLLCGDDWNEVRESSRLRPWGHGHAMRTHQKALAAVTSHQAPRDTQATGNK